MEYLVIIISSVLVKNILLAQYLGTCPFLGTSKRMDTAVGMGLSVIFTITLSTFITWVVQTYALKPMDLEYLQTIVFILVIASLVQLVEMFLKKMVPPLYKALGIFLPLITTNCAVLGLAIICIREKYDLVTSVIFSVSSASGFALALILFAAIRERFEISRIPKPLQGTGIGLITAGLMAVAFLGFMGVDTALNALSK